MSCDLAISKASFTHRKVISVSQSIIKVYSVFIFMVMCLSTVVSAEIVHSGKKDDHAIVFLPGLASHGSVWQPWVDTYAKTHSVYVLTASGFAGVAPYQSDAAFLLSTVQEVIGALKQDRVKKATIVGHSIGGLMALMIANEAPSITERLLIVDSLPYLGGLFMPGLLPDAVEKQAALMAHQMASMPRSAFDEQQKYGLRIQSKTETFLPKLERWSKASDQQTIATAFKEVLSTDYRDNVSTIKVPVTVLVAHSAQAPLSREQILGLYQSQYENLAEKKIQVIDDSYHFIMIDQPVDFSAVLASILEKG